MTTTKREKRRTKERLFSFVNLRILFSCFLPTFCLLSWLKKTGPENPQTLENTEIFKTKERRTKNQKKHIGKPRSGTRKDAQKERRERQKSNKSSMIFTHNRRKKYKKYLTYNYYYVIIDMNENRKQAREAASVNDFIKALGGKPTEPEIIVYFKGSSEAATFTKAVLHLLKTDPATEKIIDKATGETIYSR